MKIECECGERFVVGEMILLRNLAPLRIDTSCPECGRGYLLRLNRNRNADDFDKRAKKLAEKIMDDPRGWDRLRLALEKACTRQPMI